MNILFFQMNAGVFSGKCDNFFLYLIYLIIRSFSLDRKSVLSSLHKKIRLKNVFLVGKKNKCFSFTGKNCFGQIFCWLGVLACCSLDYWANWTSSVQMNIYQSNTYRKDLSWLNFDVESRIQEKQQMKEQQSYILGL